MNDYVLMHHGIKGQRWGIRRYQNKDGSLTPVGRKKVAKLKSQYTELTGKQLRRSPTKKSSSSNSESKSQNESLEEKTKKLQTQKSYLQTQKDVLDLQRQISAMSPRKISKGKSFVQKFGGTIAKTAWNDVGKPTLNKYLEKKMGLKDTVSESERLAKEAKDYENRQKVDKGQQYFKEGKYAEKKKHDSSNETERTETWSGTVEGEGTSRAKRQQKTRSGRNDEPIDVEWAEVNSYRRPNYPLLPVKKKKKK